MFASKTGYTFRLILICLFFLTSLELHAQKKYNWNYGITPAFNVTAVKPISNDTFSSRASIGLSAFLEFGNEKFGLRLAPGYSQNSVIHDPTNLISFYQSLDASFDFIKYFKSESQTSVHFGLVPSFTYSKKLSTLDQAHSVMLINGSDLKNKFDLGLKFGVSFEASSSVRVELNYFEYLRGEQFRGRMKPRLDYFQLALQIRASEIEFNAHKFDQVESEINQIRDGVLIFALQTQTKFINSILDPKKKVYYKQLLDSAQQNQVKQIYRHYNFSDFLVVLDSNLNRFRKGELSHFIDSNLVQVKRDTFPSNYHVALVGKSFTADNRPLRRGVFIFDKNMDLLEDPFPFFTSYGLRDEYLLSDDGLKFLVTSLNRKFIETYTRLHTK